MAQTASNVFDLLYPSPASLRQLSATAFGVQLWRWKLQTDGEHVIPPRGVDFNYWRDRSFKTVIPNAPSMICQIVEEATKKVGNSCRFWWRDHLNTTYLFRCLLSQHHGRMTTFMDCFCGFDEVVDYVQIAKRTIQCDLLSEHEKFEIACMYCLEDDIRRMWPFVSENRHLFIDFNIDWFEAFPNLYYWVYLLDNKLEQIPDLPLDGANIEEEMFDRCKSYNYSALEHFWNRISSDRRSQKALDLYSRDKQLFCRYLLPRLNDSELDRFVSEKGVELLIELLLFTKADKKWHQYVLPTWFYIGSKMKEPNLFRLVLTMLTLDTSSHIAEDALRHRLPEIQQRFSTEHMTYLFCEIWKSIHHTSKRSLMRELLIMPNDMLRKEYIRPSEPREVKLLLTMLLDATAEERNTSWCNNWHYLIVNTRTSDLHRIMLMCFKNENEIAQFKDTVMTEYENIRPYCVKLLTDGFFEELGDFLSFCCSSNQSKQRDLKKRLLQSNFLGEESVLNVLHFGRIQSMSEFIRDAFDDDPILGAKFLIQLGSLPIVDQCLFECIRFGYFPSAIQFVKMFIPDDRKTQLKQHFVELLRNHLMNGFVSDIRVVYLQEFLVWCLGNDDAVDAFKSCISVHEVFNNMVEEEMYRATLRNGLLMYPRNLNQFLMWYFSTPEEINEFRRQYDDVFKMFPSR
ncbi:uncharacterized protein LOC135834500 isoform X1 [Planococcus citri]|uniref:uncharacterized protein LOC135834500 isoform X1 n=1 Tax=Planococcus citri TaxID=170843 RepID=UPI0031F9C408